VEQGQQLVIFGQLALPPVPNRKIDERYIIRASAGKFAGIHMAVSTWPYMILPELSYFDNWIKGEEQARQLLTEPMQ
jgi:hypothetical protein